MILHYLPPIAWESPVTKILTLIIKPIKFIIIPKASELVKNFISPSDAHPIVDKSTLPLCSHIASHLLALLNAFSQNDERLKHIS